MFVLVRSNWAQQYVCGRRRRTVWLNLEFGGSSD
jgi:hypothetical protein